jgi:alpha-ketoglutarate-dependent taurine dioxygenase
MMLRAINLTPKIGTEIKTDVATLLSGSAAAQIRGILEQRGIIVFRAINLKDEEQVAFARTLGELLPQGKDGIFKVTLDKNENAGAEYLKGAFYWHIDGATDNIPNLAAMLSARHLSPTGGQTEFANTYAAYEELPEAEKKEIANLRVVHSFETAQRMVNPEPSYGELKIWQLKPPKTHPLVWHHKSGRKSLVLGATASHIDGMSLDEGRALLCRLLEWAAQPEFVYVHDWTLGDLVVWDNTGVMHRVQHYALDSGRMMHRTSLAGEESLA